MKNSRYARAFVLVLCVPLALYACRSAEPPMTVQSIAIAPATATFVPPTSTPVSPTELPLAPAPTSLTPTDTPTSTSTSTATATATKTATRPPTLAPTLTVAPTRAPTKTKAPPPPPTATPGPKYAAPVLIKPTDGSGYSCKEALSLEWSGPQTLGSDEWYLIESAKLDHPDEWYGITDWLKETSLHLDPVRVKGGCNAMWWCPVRGGSEGAYYWRARIVQGDKVTHTIGAQISPPSEPRTIIYHRMFPASILEVSVSCP